MMIDCRNVHTAKWHCVYKSIGSISKFPNSNMCNGICLLYVGKHCLVVGYCLHVYSYACLHAHVHACMCACMHVWMHACICMYLGMPVGACVCMHKPNHCRNTVFQQAWWLLCCLYVICICLRTPPHASPRSAHLFDNMEH